VVLDAFENVSPLGIRIKGNTTAIKVIQDIANSCGGYVYINTLGLLSINLLTTTKYPTKFITEYMIKRRSVKLTKLVDPLNSVTINYAKNWSVTDENALDVNISPEDKTRYAKEYLSEKYTNVLTGYPLAETPDDKNTYFTTQLAAVNEAARLAELKSVQWKQYEFTVYTRSFDIQIGESVLIKNIGKDDFDSIGVVLKVRKKISKGEMLVTLYVQNEALNEFVTHDAIQVTHNAENVWN